jgi:hypothetical protein
MPDFGIMRGFNDKLFGDKLVAGQLPTQLGLIGSTIIPVLPLDLYPNAATAYSVRKLRTAYTGNSIRVRRTDLAESDIGFTSAGDLDTTALLSFVGTGALDNGFITTWYDQSGNSQNAVQTTAIKQPQIVNAGALILDNGKPAIQFDGINDSLNKNFAIGNIFTRFIIFNHFSNQNNNHIILDSGLSSDQAYLLFSSTNTLRAFTGANIFYSPVFNNTQNLAYNLANATFGELGNNGNTPTTQIMTVPNVNGITIGCRGGNSQQFFANFKTQEIIYYNTNQSSNRTGIETNLNTYYAIY